MGQINCNCQQNIQKTVTHQKQINFAKINPQYDSIKIKNRVYSIIKSNSHRKIDFAEEISKIQPLKLDRQLEAILTITNLGTQNIMEFRAYYNQQNQFYIGTQDDIVPEYRIHTQNCQEKFKLFVRYLKNGKNEGNFYLRDEGIGLGCFIKINNQQKFTLCENMLVMFGNEFIVPIFTENIVTLGKNKEQEIIIKVYGEYSKSQYLYLNNSQFQEIQVGRAEECKLRFDDPLLSNIHFKIKRQQDTWYIIDEINESDYHSGTWIYLNKMTKIDKQVKLKLGNEYYKIQVQKI